MSARATNYNPADVHIGLENSGCYSGGNSKQDEKASKSTHHPRHKRGLFLNWKNTRLI